ncbi:MAG: NAD(P)/FAD-dependent oxidoreductase [Mycobacterium sp.]|nr:NAD(P)/FAD-dependent oxidoreductase [Mycobacterium sp.]
MASIEVVGGGLAGLVAAVECAERGANVVLFEGTHSVGGRARSVKHDGYTTNLGPHALYQDGDAWAWLRERELLPETVSPPTDTFRYRYAGRLERRPEPLRRALQGLAGPAPHELDFASWAEAQVGRESARVAAGVLTLPLFDADPGRYSASFAFEVFTRLTTPGIACYVVGGWSELVDRLERRVRELGVRIETNVRVTTITHRPTIVATGAHSAARLLKDGSLRPARRQVGLVNVGTTAICDLSAVLDLDRGVYAVRSNAADSSLAPSGHSLLQCSAGLFDGELSSAAYARIEDVLDHAFPGWRSRCAFVGRMTVAAPAAPDLPGSTFRDRPPIDYGGGVYLAGDYVASPGLLSEVCFNSARNAAAVALDAGI